MGAQMTDADTIFLPRSSYDSFLFALVGESSNNMPFTVLSALARRDVDPWMEAEKLSRMPRKQATERLALLIGSPPSGLAAHLDPLSVAATLIALLPHRGGLSAPLGEVARNTPLRSRSRTAMAVIISIFLFGAIWVFQNSALKAQSDMPNGRASAPVSAEIASSPSVR